MSYQIIYVSSGPFVITLEKHPDTECDESRDGIIDPKYARYWCQKAKVLEIEHKMTKEYLSNQGTYPGNFVVGEIYSGGMDYFKTYQAAFYDWLLVFVGIDNGPYKKWFRNGAKREEYVYKDREYDGSYMSWYENGQKEKECTFKNGKLDGPYTSWYANGQKCEECTYKGDHRVGPHRSWTPDGHMKAYYRFSVS